LTSSLLRNDGLDFSGVSSLAFSSSIATVLLGMAGALVLFLFSSKLLASSPMFKKMVLATELSSGTGYSSAINLPTIGSRGKTSSLLRPSGKVIINDHLYTASCESGFVEMDVEVEVVNILGGNLIVRPL
jgi:membrane-bound serine protease (ClpP class)